MFTQYPSDTLLYHFPGIPTCGKRSPHGSSWFSFASLNISTFPIWKGYTRLGPQPYPSFGVQQRQNLHSIHYHCSDQMLKRLSPKNELHHIIRERETDTRYFLFSLYDKLCATCDVCVCTSGLCMSGRRWLTENVDSSNISYNHIVTDGREAVTGYRIWKSEFSCTHSILILESPCPIL